MKDLRGKVKIDKFITQELPERYGVSSFTLRRWVKRLFPRLVERGVMTVEDRLAYEVWKVTDKEKFVKVLKEEIEKWKSKSR